MKKHLTHWATLAWLTVKTIFTPVVDPHRWEPSSLTEEKPHRCRNCLILRREKKMEGGGRYFIYEPWNPHDQWSMGLRFPTAWYPLGVPGWEDSMEAMPGVLFGYPPCNKRSP